jgi:hypothetical protein
VQGGAAVNGACYHACIPFTSSCGAGQDCLSLAGDDSIGACFATGTVKTGDACTPSDTASGCQPGDACILDQGSTVCRQRCNYFASSPGCNVAERCAYGGVCSAESGDSAAIGQACSSSSQSGERCGNDGKAWRGACSGPGAACVKVCRTSKNDCPAGQACLDTAEPGVGVCGAPQGCNTMASAQCATCCDSTFAAGAQAASNYLATACGCQAGSTCNSACNGNFCAGAAPSAQCISCLDGIVASDACVNQYSTTCNANADCLQWQGCRTQCP